MYLFQYLLDQRCRNARCDKEHKTFPMMKTQNTDRERGLALPLVGTRDTRFYEEGTSRGADTEPCSYRLKIGTISVDSGDHTINPPAWSWLAPKDTT